MGIEVQVAVDNLEARRSRSRVIWPRLRRFPAKRPHALAAGLLILSGLCIGVQQWFEIRTHSLALQRKSARLDIVVAQLQKQVAAQAASSQKTSKDQLPPLSAQGKTVTDLNTALQAKGLESGSLNFSKPAYEKNNAYWQQDISVKLSGPYRALTDTLLALPRAMPHVALISMKLARDNQDGRIECEALLRAYFARSPDHVPKP